MNITILCKVVDNFGDIGVVFRMTERLLFLKPELQLNLIVDDLISFNKINSNINPEKDYQMLDGIHVYRWNAFDICYNQFSQKDGEKLSVILECFQCGRPDWMEKILFEDKLERTVHVIMIDYLTAEQYAEDFHGLGSLTRSAKVQKVNFMPGFTNKTGGLIIDKGWELLSERNPVGDILIFTYERDWSPLVKAIKQYQIENPVKVLAAQGRGLDSVLNSWDKVCENKGKLQILDFMNQWEWDEMMKKCSVLFIRGEESMSRACLSGIPFVWHAYPQSDEYQLVKVKALLSRISSYFEPEDYEIIEKVWLCFNSPENEVSDEEMEKSVLIFLKKSNQLTQGFRKFAQEIRNNKDLCYNLMTFIENNYIISK